MSFFSQLELKKMKFKFLGSNVLISDKASIYNVEDIEIGNNSRIDDFCVMSGNIKIGNNVHIAIYCNIAGGEKGIYIDDFSGLAYGCHVFSQSDDYSGQTLTNPTIPDKYKNEFKSPVYIERHCIVGAKSVIMPGVTLAEGTAVGAMSLINKQTAPWSIYFGIPAKKIKNRSRELLNLEKEYLNTLVSEQR